MKLIVDQKIFERFPGVMIGVIVAKGAQNTRDVSAIHEVMRSEESRIRSHYVKETLSQVPKINAWRKAYSSFGVKSSDAKASIENLYRMVLSGREIRAINPLVDIYNFISIKYMVPVGGEDLDKVVGDIELTLAGPNEPSVQLLGDHAVESPPEGEVLYKDDISALCRRWNWREAERTMLTEHTKNAILVLEGIPPITREEIGAAIAELKELAEEHCKATTRTAILAENNTQFIIN